jgi:hypothetical protein
VERKCKDNVTGRKGEKDSAAMVDSIIVGLKSLSVSKKDKWRVKNAIKSMESIQRRRAVTMRAVQRNIDDTMEAIDSVLSIKSADVSEIRLMMDVPLEVYFGKLFFPFKLPTYLCIFQTFSVLLSQTNMRPVPIPEKDHAGKGRNAKKIDLTLSPC